MCAHERYAQPQRLVQRGLKGYYAGARLTKIRPPAKLLKQGVVLDVLLNAIVIDLRGCKTRAECALVYKKRIEDAIRGMPAVPGKWGQSVRVRATPSHQPFHLMLGHRTPPRPPP